jgi:hypothetical protein
MLPEQAQPACPNSCAESAGNTKKQQAAVALLAPVQVKLFIDKPRV